MGAWYLWPDKYACQCIKRDDYDDGKKDYGDKKDDSDDGDKVLDKKKYSYWWFGK
jgi:hypothetical protein